MYVYTETETNYWQHCAKRNAPVLNLLRGRFWNPVYMIQPFVKPVNWLYNRFDNQLYTRYSCFVKPVVKRVWQSVECLYTRYNRLSNRLSNRFDNRLYRVYKHSTDCQTRLTTGLTNGCIVYTAGCQTGCTTRFDNRLNEQPLFIQHGCQTGCTTGLTTGRIV